MDSIKPKITWKTFVLPAIGLLAFVAYLILFKVDIPGILEKARLVNPLTYSIAIILVIVDPLLFAASWWVMLNFLSIKVSVFKAYLYTWYGIFIDIMIPGESVSSEISRVYLVTRDVPGTSGKAVASVVTHRIMSMGMTVATMVFGTAMLLGQGQTNTILFNLSLLSAILTSISLVFLILLCTRENWAMKLVNMVLGFVEYVGRGRWKLDKIREDAHKAARIFHESMKELGHNPRILVESTSLFVLSWIASASVPYFVFLAIGFPVDWSAILITSAIVSAIKSIPIGIPFEVGLPEIVMTLLYGFVSPVITTQIAATVTVLTRILTLWMRFFIGFVAQQWLEYKAIKIPTTKLEEQEGLTPSLVRIKGRSCNASHD
jgi:uncharacterized protein (TIRG00374 family)